MRDITAVLDAVGAQRATLLSFSEGGQLAILFAATCPERTESLVLCSAMARASYAEDHPWLPRDEDFDEGFVDLLMPAWGTDVMIDFSVPSRTHDTPLKKWYAMLERSVSPGMLGSVSAMFRDTDVRAVLPSVRVPTLVLHRRGDRVVNIRSGRYLAEHIPGATLVEIPGSDHIPFFETPEVWTDAIEEFLTGAVRAVPTNRRLATVMFSDIVASTELAAAMGDARWRELLGRHDEVVRAELGRNTGVAVKTLGDGFLATFDGPTAAIRGACAIRDATSEAGLESSGQHTLKGVPNEWEIVAVAR